MADIQDQHLEDRSTIIYTRYVLIKYVMIITFTINDIIH